MDIVESISLTDFARILDSGSIIIYPTDTVYGIGCDATNAKSVTQLRRIKARAKNKPISVIVPSKEWIRDHCVVNPTAEEYISKLPGPFTLVLPLKDLEIVPEGVKGTDDSIGDRKPKHWISDAVTVYGKPVITTSVNPPGEGPAHTLAEIPQSISKEVDLAINDGPCDSTPSTVVDLRTEKVEILR